MCVFFACFSCLRSVVCFVVSVCVFGMLYPVYFGFSCQYHCK